MASTTAGPPHHLTFAHGIGIGVVVGFFGVAMLVVAFYDIKHTRFSPKSLLSKLKGLFQSLREPLAGDEGSGRVSPVLPQLAPPQLINQPPRRVAATYTKPTIPSRMGDELILFDEMVQRAAGFDYWIDDAVEPTLAGTDMPQVSESLFDENQLVSLAGEPPSGQTWSQSVSCIGTRLETVKRFIAEVLLRRMHPLCDPQLMLLPPEIASCYQYIMNTDCGYEKSFAPVWREIAFLIADARYTIWPLPRACFRNRDDPRRERVDSTVTLLTSALKIESLVVKMPDYFQNRLRSVVEQASNSALVLFGQPWEWEYEWVQSEPGPITFPEIWLLSDGLAKVSSPARISKTEGVRRANRESWRRKAEEDAAETVAPVGTLPNLAIAYWR